MSKSILLRRILFLLPLLALSVVRGGAQSAQTKAPPDELFRTIAAQDAALFDAYNRCDLDKLGALVTDDLEFYHDQTGLSVGKQIFVDSIKKNICGKVSRELVPGTLEVYPLNDYGAVEIGVHRFHHPGADDKEPVGEAKFIMLWQYKDAAWKITRVISFDHHALTK
jgi:hypothetical protein